MGWGVDNLRIGRMPYCRRCHSRATGVDPARSVNLCMGGTSIWENQETSWSPFQLVRVRVADGRPGPRARDVRPWEVGQPRNTCELVIPAKAPNKAAGWPWRWWGKVTGRGQHGPARHSPDAEPNMTCRVCTRQYRCAVRPFWPRQEPSAVVPQAGICWGPAKGGPYPDLVT